MSPTTAQSSLQKAVADSLERIRCYHRAFGGRFPIVGEGARYQLAANDHWLAGFWPGLLWLAYAATGDDALRDHAESLLPSFEERLEKHVHINHDLGFLFTLICGDYFFLEALLGLDGKAPDFWGPERESGGSGRQS